MAKRLAELGALQDAVSNDEAAPKRLGLAGYIRGLFLDWSANPYNPLTRLSARGRLLGYFWDSGAIGLSMNFADQNYLVKDGTVKSKSFSDIVNFSRTTNATVTNSAGLITYAPHNLITFSEQFDNAAWAKSNVTVSANSSVNPVDLTTTSDKIIASAVNSTHFVSQTITTISGNVYTASVYLKAGGYDFAVIYASGANVGRYFNLSTGVVGNTFVGTPTSESITPVGDGWYRCSITFTATASTVITLYTNQTQAATFTGDGVSGTFMWGADLEIGSTATTYNPTTVKNLLGFSELFDNAAWTKSNSFVQTNLITYSEDFDNAAWTKQRATISSNVLSAPNGYQTADKLTEDTQTGNHTAFVSRSVTSGVAYTFSVYIKAAERGFAQVRYSNAGSTEFYAINVNLSDGTYAAVSFGSPTGTLSSVTPVGNGWYRCAITSNTTNTTFTAQVFSQLVQGANSYTGDNTSGIYLWGAQLVQGSVAGDYRRTDAAALPVYYPNHNGVVVAEKLVENTVNGAHTMEVNATVISGTPYTSSIYVKATERTQFSFRTNNDNTNATFNLSNGTFGTVTNGTGSIVSVGNNWYRCSLTWTATSSASVNSLRVRLIDGSGNTTYTGDGTSGIYIFGAQLSDSASLDPYVLNAAAAPTAAAFYGARFDYDPVTLAPKGLLIEEQRSNLLLNSAIAGTNLATQSVTVTAVAHTLSFYGTGTVTLTGTANTSLVGTGAYPTRSTLTFTPTAGVVLFTVTGTVQFAQLEIGSFATSFIPTATSQVTRAADVATIQGSNFYSWYNQNEGSFTVNQIVGNAKATGNATVYVDDGVSAGTASFYGQLVSPNVIRNQLVFFNSAIQAQNQSTLTLTTGLNLKSAGAYKINDFAGVLNNGVVDTDTSGATPLIQRMYLGNIAAGTQNLNGHIKSVSYYPQRLSNDVLKGLTA